MGCGRVRFCQLHQHAAARVKRRLYLRGQVGADDQGRVQVQVQVQVKVKVWVWVQSEAGAGCSGQVRWFPGSKDGLGAGRPGRSVKQAEGGNVPGEKNKSRCWLGKRRGVVEGQVDGKVVD